MMLGKYVAIHSVRIQIFKGLWRPKINNSIRRRDAET